MVIIIIIFTSIYFLLKLIINIMDLMFSKMFINLNLILYLPISADSQTLALI